MWKFNNEPFKSFYLFLSSLRIDKKLTIIGLLLIFFLYPGQNQLQTIVIKPGVVRSYNIDKVSAPPYPQNDGVPSPNTSSRSVVVQDLDSKTIMYERNADTLMMPASITKVMTALVALDTWSDLNTVIEVKNEDRAIGQTIELVQGEQISIENILYGLLVHSGNDAALALADNYPGGYSAFVDAMNQKARELHMEHTVFKNPSGVEQYGHLTTARDIATLAAVALKNPTIAGIVELRRIKVTDVTGQIVHDLETTNELLGEIPGLKGLKTGWTTNAGECLVSYTERDEGRVIIVVLGSSDRFGDTRKLVEWVFNHHTWVTPNI